MAIFTWILILSAGWLCIWCVIIIKRYRQDIALYWKEPVLKHPVLIFESDDWGAGPLIQAQALARISSKLIQYTNHYGRHPAMTLGIVLSVPDAIKIKQAQFRTYHDQRLDHPVFSPIKTAMIEGLHDGVFALQLHGMTHYWPDTLIQAMQTDEQIRHWLDQEDFPKTETLPSALQSRWTNTEQLPSSPLNQQVVEQAVNEEVDTFEALFGFKPKVVVPPTFVWNEGVERNWKQKSIRYLVTPGQCFERRDEKGMPSGTGRTITNGQLSDSGLTYLVRNDYFEPSLGHTADMAIKELEAKTHLAQPALLEIHRFNFIQDDETTKNSLNELEKAISGALEKYPKIMFLSTQELADNYSTSNEHFIEKSYLIRLIVCIKRMWANRSIRKWLYRSGLFPPFILLNKLS